MLRALTATGFLVAFMASMALGQTAPKIVIPDSERDFGEVRRGAVVTEKFEIRNEGGATLLLTGLEFSAYGMNARVRQEIAPGEHAVLELTWDTGQYSGEAEGLARLSTNDPARPHVVLTLAGVVIPPIEVSPYPAFYLSQFAGEEVAQSVTIRNHQEHPVTVTGVEEPSDLFSTRVETLEPGRAYRLHVTVAPDAPVGRWRERLHVLTDDPRRKRIGVEVNILIKPDVFLSADAIDFGRVSMAQLRREPARAELLTESVIVTRRTGEMRVTGLKSGLPFATLRQQPEGASRAFRIDVGIDPALLAPGEFDDVLRLLTDDPSFPEIEIPMHIVVVE